MNLPTSSSRGKHTLAARLLGAAVVASLLPAQGVTDPAIPTAYGLACGLTLTASDTIDVGGGHALQLAAANASAFAPVVLVLGFTQVDLPIVGSNCRLLCDPITTMFGVADGAGDANFALSLPGWFQGNLKTQVGSLGLGNTIHTSAGLDLLFPGHSPTVDPTTQTSYPCWYYQDLVWNYGGDGVGNVTGRVYFPSSSCQFSSGPPANRPVVVFTHGNGMTHTDHDYLCGHLARNGFVVLSVANGSHLGGSNEGRAREAISFLNGMHAFWSWNDRLTNDVAFAGHSRGGEAAVTAARLLAQQPAMAHIAYDVKAVLPIAPTDGGNSNNDPKENLDGTMARSFFALYGSHDPDVRGIRLEDPLTGPEDTAFAIYDRAGTEGSVEGLLLPANNLTKSMVFVQGASHRGFLDGCTVGEGFPLSCTRHRDVARGYCNAFLRWQLLGQTAYRGYFDGTSVPTAVRVAGTATFPQFSDQPRRVLDNFEQGGWNVNTRGGTVVKSATILETTEDDLWQLEASAPHDTKGLRIEWTTVLGGQTPYVGWNLPAANVPLAGPARDVSGFDFLSVRVAQAYLDPRNMPGVDQDFQVRLFTGGGFSNYVRISDHGRVPSPAVFHTMPLGNPVGDYTKSAMTTIRIPLDAFSGVDLTDVQWVYFYFNVPGHPMGAVVIDSLEFAR